MTQDDEPVMVVGPAYMGDTGDGRQTLTVDVLIGCTGVTARWCPLCGDCTCRTHDDALDAEVIDSYRIGMHDVPILSDPSCPLHTPGSDHAER